MNLLQFNIPEWFFVALNLLILVVVMKRFFWKPVAKILEERQAMAEKTQTDREEAARLLEDTERRNAQADEDIRAKSAELMTEARTRAGREYDRIIAEAEERSARILEAAKVKAGQEYEKISAEATKRLSSIALEATGVLLRANMDSARNKKLVEAYLSERDASA